MIKIREAIIVEGKYDKIKLSSLIDGVILETEGFGIFKDKEKMALIKRLACKDGIVILTDSDSAGFLIRGKLSSCIAPEHIKHAYIPDIIGKEKRKAVGSKEGKLGVEGMEQRVLEEVLLKAGVNIGETTADKPLLTKADFYTLGLTGTPNSSERRQALKKKLCIPEKMPANALFRLLNREYSYQELEALLVESEQT